LTPRPSRPGATARLSSASCSSTPGSPSSSAGIYRSSPTGNWSAGIVRIAEISASWLVGIVVLVGANRAITRLFSWGDVDVGTNMAVTAGAGNPGYLLAMVVVSLCVVGPVEELLFRGVVQGRLRESWGVWPAIFVATALFGLSHVSVSGGLAGIAAYVLTATVLGVLLGYLYERTGTIVVPAVIHGVNNAVIFAGLYLGEIGVL
jgi:Predicted metal-dependent membrane protease